MIEIKGLVKKYVSDKAEVTALKNVNLHISKGEVAGIIGYSGAGKSTLVRCVNMLEKPTDGHILVDGQEITGLNGKGLRLARQKIGMVFQHFNLLSSRTVRDNIGFPLEIAGWNKKDIERRVDELLEVVGLNERADAYPAQLSGGQKQRVGIARALANQPIVLLCDEATSALDPSTTKSILTLLKDINAKFNLTIMVITHEMQVIKEICDSVSVIDDGEIVESGSVLNVFANPQKPITRGFIQSLHNLEIPAEFYEQIKAGSDSHQLARIVFTGKSAGEPVVASLQQKFDVKVNILAGNIDYIKGAPLGILTLDLAGEKTAVSKCLDYLKDLNLNVEVLTGEF